MTTNRTPNTDSTRAGQSQMADHNAQWIITSEDLQAWPLLEDRINPQSIFLDVIVLLACLGVICILSVVPFLTFDPASTWSLGRWLAVALWFTVLIIVIGFFMSKLLRRIKAKWNLKAGSSTTTARILRRGVTFSKDSYGDIHYTYHLQIEFSPTIAQPPMGPQQYKLEVSKQIFTKLAEVDSTQVKYAIRDPSVFSMTGE